MRKAPDIPPIEVKKEITSPTSGGSQIAVSIPDTGKVILASNSLADGKGGEPEYVEGPRHVARF